MKPTTYDALTLELERIDALSRHLETQLSDLADGNTDSHSEQLYAFSIVAESIRDKTAVLVAYVQGLRSEKRAAQR